MSIAKTTKESHSRAELSWIRLVWVYERIHANSAEIMKRYGISLARFDVLVHTGRQEGCSQNTLANAMFVTKGNMTQLLDGMERDGLLYRRRRGRTNLIFLTDEGRSLREKALRDQLDWIDEALSALTDDEQRQFATLLRKIDKSLPRDIDKG